MQQRLLATMDLTLQIAIDTATAMEAAARSAKQIQNRNTLTPHTHAGEEGSVLKVGQNNFRARGNQGQGNQGNDKKECYRCGSDQHSPDACYFKNQKCFHCKKVGHAKAKCRKASNPKKQGRVYYEGTEELSPEMIEEMDLVEEGLNFVTLYNLEAIDSEVDEEHKHKKLDKIDGSQLNDEVRKYKDWIQNTLEEYWDSSKEREVEVEEIDEFSDEFYEEQELLNESYEEQFDAQVEETTEIEGKGNEDVSDQYEDAVREELEEIVMEVIKDLEMKETEEAVEKELEEVMMNITEGIKRTVSLKIRSSVRISILWFVKLWFCQK